MEIYKKGDVLLSFYDKFETLCKEKGVTPTGAAREMGITQQAVSLWKKRGSTPKYTTLKKVADYFGVEIDALVVVPDGDRLVDSTLKAIFTSLHHEQSQKDSDIKKAPPEMSEDAKKLNEILMNLTPEQLKLVLERAEGFAELNKKIKKED